MEYNESPKVLSSKEFIIPSDYNHDTYLPLFKQQFENSFKSDFGSRKTSPFFEDLSSHDFKNNFKLEPERKYNVKIYTMPVTYENTIIGNKSYYDYFLYTEAYLCGLRGLLLAYELDKTFLSLIDANEYKGDIPYGFMRTCTPLSNDELKKKDNGLYPYITLQKDNKFTLDLTCPPDPCWIRPLIRKTYYFLIYFKI